MNKQQALGWFERRKESYTLSDTCQEAEDVAIECIKRTIELERTISKPMTAKAKAIEIQDKSYPVGDVRRSCGWKCGYCGHIFGSYAVFCPCCGTIMEY